MKHPAIPQSPDASTPSNDGGGLWDSGTRAGDQQHGIEDATTPSKRPAGDAAVPLRPPSAGSYDASAGSYDASAGSYDASAARCPVNLAFCEGVCVDPHTDSTHCGASADCRDLGDVCTSPGYCGAGACRGWNSEDLAETFTFYQSASDGAGIVTGWYEYDSSVAQFNMYARVFDGDRWSAPARVSDPDSSTGYANSGIPMSLSMGDGRTVFSWVQAGATQHAYAAFWDGASWGRAEVSSAASDGINEIDSATAGDWTVVALRSVTGGEPSIQLSRYTAGNWRWEQVGPPQDAGPLTVTVSAEGAGALGWVDSDGVQTALWQGSEEPNLSLLAPDRVSGEVALDAAADVVTAAWLAAVDVDGNPATPDRREVHAAVARLNQWSPPERVSLPDFDARSLLVGAYSGGAVVAWLEVTSATAETWRFARYDGETWSSPIEIAAVAKGSEARLATPDVGPASFAWFNSDSSGDKVYVDRLSGGGTPQLISDTATLLRSLAVTADGTRGLLFLDQEGTSGVELSVTKLN